MSFYFDQRGFPSENSIWIAENFLLLPRVDKNWGEVKILWRHRVDLNRFFPLKSGKWFLQEKHELAVNFGFEGWKISVDVILVPLKAFKIKSLII